MIVDISGYVARVNAVYNDTLSFAVFLVVLTYVALLALALSSDC